MSNRRIQKKKYYQKQNNREKYVMAYNKADYLRDEKKFSNSIENGKPIDWNCFKRLMINDLCRIDILNNNMFGSYSLEDVQGALEHPNSAYTVLINASDYLMRISPHYNRLNTYFSNMATFCWGIDLYDTKDGLNIEVLKNTYNALSAKLEKMNIKHEFSKIMKILPYQDFYCGVIVESNYDFFIQQIDHRLCKLKKVQDGLFNFKINLSAINPININAYPDYIKQAYIDYVDGKITCWYEPPADKQICLKLNTQWNFPYPLMIALVRDILDLDLYKKLKLQSARTDNYKAILIKVPIDEKTVDKPLLTPETLGVFAEMNKENMTDDIGIIHTLGSEGEAISFKDSSNTRNNVEDATNDIYNSGGITKELFNGSSSGTAVEYSIENDAGYVYGLYRQFERWVNRYIKLNKYNKQYFKFHFYLLDMTIYNKDKVISRYQNSLTFGAPVVDKWLAALDLTPSRIMGAFILQNEIFDFKNKLVPIVSSYNSSEGGRPTNKSKGEGLSESGEQTLTNDSNAKR